MYTPIDRSNKRLGSFLGALVVLLSLGIAHAQILTLDFSANTGSVIDFYGTGESLPASFDFGPGTNGFQWNISSETGGTGSAIGLNGGITAGPFVYGPVTTPFPGLETATVLGPLGNLRIFDGTGYLTGTVSFMDITTLDSALGGLNTSLNIDLTHISYAGTNADLLALAANQPGTLDISFQFASPHDLNSLSTTSTTVQTSYSGSITEAIPEPSSWALALLCVGLFGYVRSRTARS